MGLQDFFALFTPFVWKLGLSVMAAQCILYLLFARILPKGAWSEDPGFTAHQAISLPFMLFLTYNGFREWYSKEDHGYTAVDRILGPHPEPDVALIVMPYMLFWDIPTGLLVKSLRETAKIAHHVAMFFTAILAMGAFSGGHAILGYYAAYYFGVIELSSIPLVFVDLFHPKQKAWFALLQEKASLQSFNEFNRVSFAVLFLLVRAISFPYVSFVSVIPDIIEVTSLPIEERRGVLAAPLYAMATLNLFFSCLQFYWGTLVLRQVIKKLKPSKKPKNE